MGSVPLKYTRGGTQVVSCRNIIYDDNIVKEIFIDANINDDDILNHLFVHESLHAFAKSIVHEQVTWGNPFGTNSQLLILPDYLQNPNNSYPTTTTTTTNKIEHIINDLKSLSCKFSVKVNNGGGQPPPVTEPPIHKKFIKYLFLAMLSYLLFSISNSFINSFTGLHLFSKMITGGEDIIKNMDDSRALYYGLPRLDELQKRSYGKPVTFLGYRIKAPTYTTKIVYEGNRYQLQIQGSMGVNNQNQMKQLANEMLNNWQTTPQTPETALFAPLNLLPNTKNKTLYSKFPYNYRVVSTNPTLLRTTMRFDIPIENYEKIGEDFLRRERNIEQNKYLNIDFLLKQREDIVSIFLYSNWNKAEYLQQETELLAKIKELKSSAILSPIIEDIYKAISVGEVMVAGELRTELKTIYGIQGNQHHPIRTIVTNIVNRFTPTSADFLDNTDMIKTKLESISSKYTNIKTIISDIGTNSLDVMKLNFERIIHDIIHTAHLSNIESDTLKNIDAMIISKLINTVFMQKEFTDLSPMLKIITTIFSKGIDTSFDSVLTKLINSAEFIEINLNNNDKVVYNSLITGLYNTIFYKHTHTNFIEEFAYQSVSIPMDRQMDKKMYGIVKNMLIFMQDNAKPNPNPQRQVDLDVFYDLFYLTPYYVAKFHENLFEYKGKGGGKKGGNIRRYTKRNSRL